MIERGTSDKDARNRVGRFPVARVFNPCRTRKSGNHPNLSASISRHGLKTRATGEPWCAAVCRRIFRHSATVLMLTVVTAALSGCAASKAERAADEAVADYAVGDYVRAQKLLRPLAEKPDGDFVLNNVRLGSASLAAQDYESAEAAFLRAYEVINSVGVNNGGRSLGAVLVDEKIKVWKGEPFERAMVNFYLGVIYYVRHDYGNARGAFENALFKLRDYGEGKDKSDEYRTVESNFALGYLMLARSYQRLDRPEQAQKAFERCAELRPDLAAACDPGRNAALKPASDRGFWVRADEGPDGGRFLRRLHPHAAG